MEEWLREVFSYPAPGEVAAIAVRTLVIYAFVVTGLRLTGTRQLGQMTTYDLVLVIVIANAVQNALVGGDNTLAGGLVSAATLMGASEATTVLVEHSRWLRKEVIGEPQVLLERGRIHWDRMNREGVTGDELLAALRAHGIANPGEVRLAILEVDGTISVVAKSAPSHQMRHRIKGLKVT